MSKLASVLEKISPSDIVDLQQKLSDPSTPAADKLAAVTAYMSKLLGSEIPSIAGDITSFNNDIKVISSNSEASGSEQTLAYLDLIKDGASLVAVLPIPVICPSAIGPMWT